MKNLFWTLCVVVGTLFPVYSAQAEPETKKVCIDDKGKDGKPIIGKDGKPKQTCKTVKVHKKLEGTKVPEKK